GQLQPGPDGLDVPFHVVVQQLDQPVLIRAVRRLQQDLLLLGDDELLAQRGQRTLAGRLPRLTGRERHRGVERPVLGDVDVPAGVLRTPLHLAHLHGREDHLREQEVLRGRDRPGERRQVHDRDVLEQVLTRHSSAPAHTKRSCAARGCHTSWHTSMPPGTLDAFTAPCHSSAAGTRVWPGANGASAITKPRRIWRPQCASGSYGPYRP